MAETKGLYYVCKDFIGPLHIQLEQPVAFKRDTDVALKERYFSWNGQAKTISGIVSAEDEDDAISKLNRWENDNMASYEVTKFIKSGDIVCQKLGFNAIESTIVPSIEPHHVTVRLWAESKDQAIELAREAIDDIGWKFELEIRDQYEDIHVDHAELMTECYKSGHIEIDFWYGYDDCDDDEYPSAIVYLSGLSYSETLKKAKEMLRDTLMKSAISIDKRMKAKGGKE